MKPIIFTRIEDETTACGIAIGKRSQLVGKFHIAHGPGFSEVFEYRLSKCTKSRLSILWVKSDWSMPEDSLILAWCECDKRPSKITAQELLIAYLTAEKTSRGTDTPICDEILSSPRSLLSAEQIGTIFDTIWPVT